MPIAVSKFYYPWLGMRDSVLLAPGGATGTGLRSKAKSLAF